MRRFQLLGLCTVGALALTLGGADGGPPGGGFINPQGHPTEFKKGKPTASAVWHANGRWHLRTTTRAKGHHFKGNITVEGGTFKKIHSHHLEKTGELADYWKVGPKKHTVHFDF